MASARFFSRMSRWLGMGDKDNPAGLQSEQNQNKYPGVDDLERTGLVEGANVRGDNQGSQVLAKKVSAATKAQTLEKLQENFSELVKHLHGINEHLNRQVTQYGDLLNRIDQLPRLLESFPDFVEHQGQLREQILEQVRATTKQTDTMVSIEHKLSATADSNVQIVENFNTFNEALGRLNENTVDQTHSIAQMSNTFAASDRDLKFFLSRQNRRFMVIFAAAIGVCFVTILALVVVLVIT